MNGQKFYAAGHTDALKYAGSELERQGCVPTAHPSEAGWLLLDVPLRDDPKDILALLPGDVTVVGGNLNGDMFAHHRAIDLLQDPVYLAQNADITAHCAVKLALGRLPVILRDCPVLVVGWGRIGKCLAALLRNMGADVRVAARKDADRALLGALGYEVGDLCDLSPYRVIFNTAPALILTADMLRQCHPGCLKIDLASVPGMEGSDVIRARGLPGRDAPETSGKLIANRVLHLMKGVIT